MSETTEVSTHVKELQRRVESHDEALNGVATARSEAVTFRLAKVEDAIADADLAQMHDDVLLLKDNAIQNGSTRIEMVTADVDRIKARINQVTGLVIAAIISGLLSLLFKG